MLSHTRLARSVAYKASALHATASMSAHDSGDAGVSCLDSRAIVHARSRTASTACASLSAMATLDFAMEFASSDAIFAEHLRTGSPVPSVFPVDAGACTIFVEMAAVDTMAVADSMAVVDVTAVVVHAATGPQRIHWHTKWKRSKSRARRSSVVFLRSVSDT